MYTYYQARDTGTYLKVNGLYPWCLVETGICQFLGDCKKKTEETVKLEGDSPGTELGAAECGDLKDVNNFL